MYLTSTIVFRIHIMVTLLAVFGVLIFPLSCMPVYLSFLFIIFMMSKLNNGICVLTDLEYDLKGEPYPTHTTNPFISRVLNNIGIRVNDENIDKLVGIVYFLIVIFILLRYTIQ